MRPRGPDSATARERLRHMVDAAAALAAVPALTAAYPAVDRRPIARTRDRAAHHYWATDRELVWAAATIC